MSRGHATEVLKGATMRLQLHLLHLARVSHHKHPAAIDHAKVRHLNRLHRAGNLHGFLAPIELASIARRKHQRHQGIVQLGTEVTRLPALNKRCTLS